MDKVKENFVKRLKLAAQEVIDNAEDIVGQHDLMSSVKVTITIDTISDTWQPEISVNKSFFSDGIHAYLFEESKRR